MLKYIVNLSNSIGLKKSVAQSLFFILVCFAVHVWIIQYFYYFADHFNTIMSLARNKNNKELNSKYSKLILVWNKYDNILTKIRQSNGLIKCYRSNCIFTEDKNLLCNNPQYDAIIFNEFTLNSIDRPDTRSKSQFYIYSSQKSSYDAPACDLNNDDFFNLTFTYKLDSDVIWSYIVIRNISGEIVAPSAYVSWNNSIKPISSEIKKRLMKKKKAAVWIVKGEHGSRLDPTVLEYVEELQEYLFHYSLKIDVYGPPSLPKCPKNDCQKMIRDRYYFYLAFEDSLSEDYVTNIVLEAYNNNAVPIVYGGANYTRFLPDGSYLNAREMDAYDLASKIHKAMKDPSCYESYFRWTNLYAIEDNSKSLKPLCDLCETIHIYKGDTVKQQSKMQFRRWWNSLNGMVRCLAQSFKNDSKSVHSKYYHINKSKFNII